MARINKRFLAHPYMVVGEVHLHGGEWASFVSKIERHFKIALNLVAARGWGFEQALCDNHIDNQHLVLRPGMVTDETSTCEFHYVVVTGTLYHNLTMNEVLNGLDREANSELCYPTSGGSQSTRPTQESCTQRLHERRPTTSRFHGEVHSRRKWQPS